MKKITVRQKKDRMSIGEIAKKISRSNASVRQLLCYANVSIYDNEGVKSLIKEYNRKYNGKK